MKAYLLVFANWHAFFGNTMCLASDLGAKDLASGLNAALPELPYIVTEVEGGHKGGRIPASIYRFLNAPGPVRIEPVPC